MNKDELIKSAEETWRLVQIGISILKPTLNDHFVAVVGIDSEGIKFSYIEKETRKQTMAWDVVRWEHIFEVDKLNVK